MSFLTPFRSSRIIERMKKAKVDPSLCVGCATCVGIAAKSFKLDEVTGKATPIQPSGDEPEMLEAAKDSCPVGAISLVEEKEA